MLKQGVNGNEIHLPSLSSLVLPPWTQGRKIHRPSSSLQSKNAAARGAGKQRSAHAVRPRGRSLAGLDIADRFQDAHRKASIFGRQGNIVIDAIEVEPVH